MGYRIGGVVYLTDVSAMKAEEMEKIKGAEILVVNALRHTKHVSHFSLEEAIAFAQACAVPQVYFTHVSHQLGLHDDVEATLPSGMHLGYDGLVLKVQ
jgi:phosphoribosyl 1,2-cyclic phosphate phosphodiesterase